MNEKVRSHFDEIEARLIECPVILSYEITRRDIFAFIDKMERALIKK
jgi:hypothetical protein